MHCEYHSGLSLSNLENWWFDTKQGHYLLLQYQHVPKTQQSGESQMVVLVERIQSTDLQEKDDHCC